MPRLPGPIPTLGGPAAMGVEEPARPDHVAAPRGAARNAFATLLAGLTAGSKAADAGEGLGTVETAAEQPVAAATDPTGSPRGFASVLRSISPGAEPPPEAVVEGEPRASAEQGFPAGSEPPPPLPPQRGAELVAAPKIVESARLQSWEMAEGRGDHKLRTTLGVGRGTGLGLPAASLPTAAPAAPLPPALGLDVDVAVAQPSQVTRSPQPAASAALPLDRDARAGDTDGAAPPLRARPQEPVEGAPSRPPAAPEGRALPRTDDGVPRPARGAGAAVGAPPARPEWTEPAGDGASTRPRDAVPESAARPATQPDAVIDRGAEPSTLTRGAVTRADSPAPRRDALPDADMPEARMETSVARGDAPAPAASRDGLPPIASTERSDGRAHETTNPARPADRAPAGSVPVEPADRSTPLRLWAPERASGDSTLRIVSFHAALDGSSETSVERPAIPFFAAGAARGTADASATDSDPAIVNRPAVAPPRHGEHAPETLVDRARSESATDVVRGAAELASARFAAARRPDLVASFLEAPATAAPSRGASAPERAPAAAREPELPPTAPPTPREVAGVEPGSRGVVEAPAPAGRALHRESEGAGAIAAAATSPALRAAGPAAGRGDGTVAPPAPFAPPDVAPLARLIVEHARLQAPVLRIRLDHDKLGTIDLDLRRGPLGVRVELASEALETRRILADSLPALAQEIRATGVSLESVQVGGGQTGAAAHSFDGSSRESTPGQTARPSAPATDGDAAPGPAPRPRPRVASSRLDLLA